MLLTASAQQNLMRQGIVVTTDAEHRVAAVKCIAGADRDHVNRAIRLVRDYAALEEHPVHLRVIDGDMLLEIVYGQ
jgi:hypothetical protein